MAEAAKRIAAGDIEGGLSIFFDLMDGPGAWARHPPSLQQQVRDNARTLLGQINENRLPFSLADAQSIRTPTLFIGGEKTRGILAAVLKALSTNVSGAKVAMIPDAAHLIYDHNPVAFAQAILDFLA